MKKRKGCKWPVRTSSRNAKILSELSAQLRHTWGVDRKGTRGFPVNTAYLLAGVENRLRRRAPPRRIRKLPAPRLPRTIDALLKGVSKLVPRVYEYMYEEPIEDAFARLSGPPGRTNHRVSGDGISAYGQICDAVTTSLGVEAHGDQILPSPRGNWLHRQILDLATTAGLGDLTNREMEQFFEDVCPCGAKHSRETLKKFRQRRPMLPFARSSERRRT